MAEEEEENEGEEVRRVNDKVVSLEVERCIITERAQKVLMQR